MPIVQITSSPLKNENSRLNAKLFGTTQANVLEEELSTSGSEAQQIGRMMRRLEWKSQTLAGPLGHETIIPKNNWCFVALTGSTRVSITFGGGRKRATCDVDL
jgi:hypothetical protein